MSSLGDLQLRESEDISGIAELRATLVARLLADGDAIIIDASKVVRIDGAALQLLVTFCRAVREAGRDVQWIDVSESMQAAASVLGLKQELALA